MDNSANYSLKALNRKKWLIISCIIGVLIPITIYNYISAPIYEATTMIIYEDYTQLPLTPSFQASFGKSIINDQVKEIKSYSLSKDVFKALPQSIIETYPLPNKRESGFKEDEYITKEIQKHISTNSSINSNVIQIKVEAYAPEAAVVVANTIAEVLKERNMSVRRQATSNVRNMIEEQLKVFEEQLKHSEMVLKEFKETGKVTYIEKESEEIFRRITEAEVIYNRTKALYDATKKRYDVIQKKLADERKDLVPSITKVTSSWAQKLKEKLIDLEVQHTTLKVQNYPDNHPKILKLRKQIEQTKQSLKQETLKITQGENIVDPLSQIHNYLKELISLDIELETYGAQKDALEKIIEKYNEHLVTVPEKEMQLAQLTRELKVNNQIYTTLLQKREEAKIADAEKIGNIRTIDSAILPKNPIKPRKVLNTIIGLLIGTILGVGLALFLEQKDNTLKTVDDLEKYGKFSVLGSIPAVNFKDVATDGYYKQAKQNAKKGIKDERYKLIDMHLVKSQFVESFRSLRTYIQFMRVDTPLASIMITSPTPQDGKSLISANLAISMAQVGLKTLLVDTDLRKPVQHVLFAKKKIPGLTDFLLAEEQQIEKDQADDNFAIASANNELVESFDEYDENIFSDYTLDSEQKSNRTLTFLFNNIVNQTNLKNLTLLTCGRKPLDPSAIVSSNSLKNLLDMLKSEFDLVIIDSPPVLPVTDAIVLAKIVDAIIFIVKAGRSNEEEITRASNLIKKRGKIIGVVLNNVELDTKYYNYYDEKGKKKKRKRQVVI